MTILQTGKSFLKNNLSNFNLIGPWKCIFITDLLAHKMLINIDLGFLNLKSFVEVIILLIFAINLIIFKIFNHATIHTWLWLLLSESFCCIFLIQSQYFTFVCSQVLHRMYHDVWYLEWGNSIERRKQNSVHYIV